MIVYHGTILHHAMDISSNGINLSKGNRYLDFGKGFYVTPNYEMAKKMANRVFCTKGALSCIEYIKCDII